jgi:hypothetical protein
MYKWFAKKFKKDKMTEAYLANINEELSNIPKFQWIKTDRAGTISYFKSIIAMDETVFVEFKDGSRIKYELLGDIVMRIYDDSMLLHIENVSAPINSPLQVQIGKPAVTNNSNPVYALLSKQKVNMVPIEISVELNLPAISLYKVLSQSFEEADNDIVEFIIADLDITKIRAAVRTAITNFYENTNG